MDPVVTKFERIGAKARIEAPAGQFSRGWRNLPTPDLSIDVRAGRFIIRKPDNVALEVLDFDAFDRHLLLLARGPRKSRFLCGHDEREWFVAAIPETAPVSTVAAAKEALKPTEVQTVEHGLGEWAKKQRRNARRIRQGEWFFLPDPSFAPPKVSILYKEPIGRMQGGRFLSRPHLCDELVRFGGTTVYVPRAPIHDVRTIGRATLEKEIGTGLTDAAREKFQEKYPQSKDWVWQNFVRDAMVYVRGRVRHPDHATLRLKVWHKVVQNTEVQARAMRLLPTRLKSPKEISPGMSWMIGSGPNHLPVTPNLILLSEA